jgi:uncharacterized protein YkwD
MKTRIFRLVTAIAVVFTFIGSVLSTTQPFTMFSANGAAVYDSDTLEKYAHEVADIVNRERSANGLKPLKYSEKLSKAANLRANEIQTYFSHTRPNGTSCFTAVTELGIRYRYIGENIAYGQRSPEEVMNGWMNSSGHRANILNSNVEYMGIGVAQRNGVYYWTQFFAASDDLEKDASEPAATTISTSTVQTTQPAQTTYVQTSTATCKQQDNYSARIAWLRNILRRYGIELDDILSNMK